MAKSNNKFYNGMYSEFKPVLILSQIACLQCSYYAGLTLVVLMLNGAFGLPLHLGQYFHYSQFNTTTHYGTVGILSQVLNVPLTLFAHLFLVRKASKVLDFTTTTFFLHFLFCLFYNGFKFVSFGYFLIYAVIYVATVLSSEYLLIRHEQKEISLFSQLPVVTPPPQKEEHKYSQIEEPPRVTMPEDSDGGI